MATNDALFSVTGYVATQPKKGATKAGTTTLTFRIGWTPREVSRQTGEWADLPSSFASVTCYRKIAENGAYCLRKGDPIVLKGTLRVREYEDQAGIRRNSVDVVADFLGHDLAKGTSNFTKHSQRSQQTAEEYELSKAVEGNRLPGDVEADQWHDELQPGVGAIEPDELVAIDGAEASPADGDHPERAAVLASTDRDDLDRAAALPHPDGDDGDDGDDSDDDATDQTEPGEVAESQPPARGGRYRKAQAVGAGV